MESPRRIWTEHNLFQDAASFAAPPVGQQHVGSDEGLHMQVRRRVGVGLREYDAVITEGEFAFVEAMGPFRMAVAETGHVELALRF